MKKLKAVTFSFDDAVEQDKRLIEIFDRYGLKCTFNINSGMMGMDTCHDAMLFGEMRTFRNHRIPRDEIKEVYQNHEVAAHSVSHPILPLLEKDEEVIFQMREDAKALEAITGKRVNGFAYPGGYCEYYNDRVKKLIFDNTKLRYGRTAKSSYSFDLPDDLMIFHPTISHRELDIREKMTDEFLALESETPKMFYIWGHSYEMINERIWYDFEKLCERLAGKDDIFYGTNYEIFERFGVEGE